MTQACPDRPRNRWLRLGVGTAVLATVFALLSQGPLVPGVAGRVLEHNREHDLEATALFYSDLERMPEIQARLERKRGQIYLSGKRGQIYLSAESDK
jgi:hypothetical protein